jgi:nitronate monooxygenase
MLRTILTEKWGLLHPVLNAPMANIAHGRLAKAVSLAGGLGMLGIGRDTPEFIEREVALIRQETPEIKFGIGLLGWAIKNEPALFEAALAARPFLISISAGEISPYVQRLHEAGILVATQVHSREEALAAQEAGVDLIAAQGTEAGGHTNKQVSTLPLLQVVLEAVQVPVLASGGVASAPGMAAVLAAGAAGVWSGTAFLACPEANVVDSARQRVLQAKETDTVLTAVYDRANGLPWPESIPGRALRNDFTNRWDGHEKELVQDQAALDELKQATAGKDYRIAVIFAGEAVGLVNRSRGAAEVVQGLSGEAEQLLRWQLASLLGEKPEIDK